MRHECYLVNHYCEYSTESMHGMNVHRTFFLRVDRRRCVPNIITECYQFHMTCTRDFSEKYLCTWKTYTRIELSRSSFIYKVLPTMHLANRQSGRVL